MQTGPPFNNNLTKTSKNWALITKFCFREDFPDELIQEVKLNFYLVELNTKFIKVLITKLIDRNETDWYH